MVKNKFLKNSAETHNGQTLKNKIRQYWKGHIKNGKFSSTQTRV